MTASYCKEPSGRRFPCRFAAAIYVKEECRSSYKEDGATHHPRFIGGDGRNLLGRKKGQGDAKCSGQQAADAREQKSFLSIADALEIRGKRDLDQGAEHVEERNQLQHNRKRKHSLKRFLHAGAHEI